MITSKAVSNLGLAVPDKLASLWKGSLFSESELASIRQKRESGMTPDEKVSVDRDLIYIYRGTSLIRSRQTP